MATAHVKEVYFKVSSDKSVCVVFIPSMHPYHYLLPAR